MVLLGGARQVGKTQLLGANQSYPAYLNWDAPGIASELLKGILLGNQSLLILDEIHKYEHWRNLIKGLYDQHKHERHFLTKWAEFSIQSFSLDGDG